MKTLLFGGYSEQRASVSLLGWPLFGIIFILFLLRYWQEGPLVIETFPIQVILFGNYKWAPRHVCATSAIYGATWTHFTSTGDDYHRICTFVLSFRINSTYFSSSGIKLNIHDKLKHHGCIYLICFVLWTYRASPTSSLKRHSICPTPMLGQTPARIF